MVKNVGTLEERINELERQNRQKYLRIVGLALSTTSEVLQFLKKKAELVSHFITLCKGCDVQDIDIQDTVSSTLLKIPGSNQHECLLIELQTVQKKMTLYKQRTLLRKCNQHVYINEHLTKVKIRSRSDVKSGKLSSTWTMNGQVWAKATKRSKAFCVSEDTN